MAPQFKNRLVGITILVALVVIFLPSLIDGKKTAYQEEFVAIPISPEVKVHSKAFAKQTILVDESLSDEMLTDSNETASEWKVEEIAEPVSLNEPASVKKIAAVKSEKVSAKKDVVTFTDPAWTIQLGAFQNKANINSLIRKLNKAGFRVHTIPKQIVDGKLTRVFIGPDISKTKLEKKLPRLKQLTNLNGKLVPFNPIKP